MTTLLFNFSCNGPEDDEYRPCFECDGFSARKVYGEYANNFIQYNYTSRQSGENFQATQQSSRVMCRLGISGILVDCKLRVSRGMQLRSRSYERAQEFVQSEQYLSQEDIDLIFRYLSSF